MSTNAYFSAVTTNPLQSKLLANPPYSESPFSRSAMSPTRLGVIGAGMAGPVLAVFLKAKGYDPVVFERRDFSSDAGLGMGCVSSQAPFICLD